MIFLIQILDLILFRIIGSLKINKVRIVEWIENEIKIIIDIFFKIKCNR